MAIIFCIALQEHSEIKSKLAPFKRMSLPVNYMYNTTAGP